MTDTPVPIPSTPMSAALRHEIELAQRAFFGMSASDVVVRGTCLECDAYGITQRSFRSVDAIRWYMLFGMCQNCQDNMKEWITNVPPSANPL